MFYVQDTWYSKYELSSNYIMIDKAIKCTEEVLIAAFRTIQRVELEYNKAPPIWFCSTL